MSLFKVVANILWKGLFVVSVCLQHGLWSHGATMSLSTMSLFNRRAGAKDFVEHNSVSTYNLGFP